jgi:hypothetical protein
VSGTQATPESTETAALAGTGLQSPTTSFLIIPQARGRHDVTQLPGQASTSCAQLVDRSEKFTKIHMHFIVTGRQLNDVVVQRVSRVKMS